jgi:hypothetical protein
MEKVIKLIDEKLVELGYVPEVEFSEEEEKEYFDLLDNMLLWGYTEEEIIEFESDEELEMGAPMGNQNASGPHGGGGSRGSVRRAQYKKDMAEGIKHHTGRTVFDGKKGMSAKEWAQKRRSVREGRKAGKKNGIEQISKAKSIQYKKSGEMPKGLSDKYGKPAYAKANSK